MTTTILLEIRDELRAIRALLEEEKAERNRPIRLLVTGLIGESGEADKAIEASYHLARKEDAPTPDATPDAGAVEGQSPENETRLVWETPWRLVEKK